MSNFIPEIKIYTADFYARAVKTDKSFEFSSTLFFPTF